MAINAATPGKIKGTSITAPSASGDNHSLVLGQLKETTEIAQRLRGDPNDSFVRVSEINSALGTRMVNNTLQPPNSAGASSGGGTVSTADSIVGDGSSGSPLKLDGDSTSPGNNMFYGTNGSGVKSWYAAGGGGGSLTLTDGTNTVTGVTNIAVTGLTVGGSSPNATLTVSSSGGGTPTTIANLCYWFDASLLPAGGTFYPLMTNLAPAGKGYDGVLGLGGLTVSTVLNGLNVATFDGATGYALPGAGIQLSDCSIFIVMNPVPGFGSNPSIFSTVTTGGFGYFIFSSSGSLSIVDQGIAVIGSSTTATPSNTWLQANVTWEDISGNFIFRQASAPAGSGTNPRTITSGTGGVCVNGNGSGGVVGSSGFIGQVAELIVYNRTLSPTEVGVLESYILAKWGV